MLTNYTFAGLQHQLAAERRAIVEHPLYGALSTEADMRTFMEHHVFAVWDFMSLLKCLQRQLTCVDVPWVPRGNALARRLINEIVLGEESDDSGDGGYTSHFELYRAAMLDCGANTSCIDRFVGLVERGVAVPDALVRAGAPGPARSFVEGTFATIESGSTVRVAAAFTLGREEVIPAMFTRLVADLSGRTAGHLTRFVDYLDRHIRLDGDRHGPMAARMLESLCGTDDGRWREAEAAARAALAARCALWDGVLSAIQPSAVLSTPVR